MWVCVTSLSVIMVRILVFFVFFFNDTATTEIYTLSLHDALPICVACGHVAGDLGALLEVSSNDQVGRRYLDRKSTRLNSSHQIISYAVFCLKKKNTSTASNKSLEFIRLV